MQQFCILSSISFELRILTLFRAFPPSRKILMSFEKRRPNVDVSKQKRDCLQYGITWHRQENISDAKISFFFAKNSRKIYYTSRAILSWFMLSTSKISNFLSGNTKSQQLFMFLHLRRNINKILFVKLKQNKSLVELVFLSLNHTFFSSHLIIARLFIFLGQIKRQNILFMAALWTSRAPLVKSAIAL